MTRNEFLLSAALQK